MSKIYFTKVQDEFIKEKQYNFNDNTETYQLSYKYVKYDVTSLVGKKLLISGFTGSVENLMNFGLYAFYNESNNLIRSFGASNTSYTNVEVVVPNGAKYLIVNGGKSRWNTQTEANCDIIYYKNVKDILTTDLEILKTRLYNYEPLQAIEKASGKYGRFDEATKVIDPRKE